VATEAIVRLEDGDLRILTEDVRGRQAGDAGSDHGD
jgi:hypothetical protein